MSGGRVTIPPSDAGQDGVTGERSELGDSTSQEPRQSRRGAPLKVLEDRTSLSGDRVDVAARIAWLLRTSRLVAPATRSLPQYAMVDRLARVGLTVSRNWVHRLEAGELRSGVGAEGYERVLGLEPGRLRAAIDIACRSTPESPVDSDPGELLDDVMELSEATDAVLGDRPTGWQWFTWARQFSRDEVRGLRVPVARRLIGRLSDELGRSVDVAYDARYEALAALRGGPYGQLVIETVRETIDDEHVQVVMDLVSVVTEVSDPDAFELCVGLVCDDRSHVVQAAVHGLENLLSAPTEHEHDWRRLGAVAVRAFNDADPDSDQAHALAHLLRLLASRRVRLERPARPLPPTASLDRPGRASTAEQWGRCLQLADEICDAVGLGHEPMLARLLFDLLISWSSNRAFPSSRILAALPFAPVVVDHVVAFVEDEPDPLLRGRMLGRVAMVAGVDAPDGVERWLHDPELRPAGLVLLAHGGVQPPAEQLRAMLADRASWRRALYAAGMTGHPVLQDVRTDGAVSAEVRGAAAWWSARGGRVVDPVEVGPAPLD